MKKLICFGHRGAMGYEPENTLRSVTRALDLGCEWIEIDVYYVDGHLVVIHDEWLERTTNGNGRVIEQSFDYLRSLDAGQGERIPTLVEVIDLVDKRAGLNIELKGAGTAAPVAELLADYLTQGWSREKFLVSSFNHKELKLFKSLLPEINIGALIVGLPEDNAAFAERLGCYSINPSIEFIDDEFVEDAHRRGLKVFVFTVNHPKDINRMRQLEVDGIFCNYPDRVC